MFSWYCMYDACNTKGTCSLGIACMMHAIPREHVLLVLLVWCMLTAGLIKYIVIPVYKGYNTIYSNLLHNLLLVWYYTCSLCNKISAVSHCEKTLAVYRELNCLLFYYNTQSQHFQTIDFASFVHAWLHLSVVIHEWVNLRITDTNSATNHPCFKHDCKDY